MLKAEAALFAELNVHFCGGTIAMCRLCGMITLQRCFCTMIICMFGARRGELEEA